MVDYSKWNNYTDTDSDDDDQQSSAPTITTLEPNSRIEIGPQGSSISAGGTPQHIISPQSSSTVMKDKQNDGIGSTASSYREEGFAWQQTRLEVILQLFVPPKYVELMKQVPKRSGLMSLRCNARRLLIKVGDEVYIDKQLAYDVVETDKDGDCAVDWEIKSMSDTSGALEGQQHKEVWVTMKKKSPIANAVQWWSKVFIDDVNEIDVTKIPCRLSSSKADKIEPNSFQSVWKSAHEQFIKNVSNRSKVEVAVDSEDAEESAVENTNAICNTSTNTLNSNESEVSSSSADCPPVNIAIVGDVKGIHRLHCSRKVDDNTAS